MSGTSTVLDSPSTPTADGLPSMSLEHLEAEICALAGQIAAATCRLLMAIAIYDRREGWAEWECHSMAHWLSWKCGMARVTAREHVRVARALEDLPALTSAFAAGRLSYSQMRAVTRIATPETDGTLAALARCMTGGQLDRLVSAYRGVKAATLETAETRIARRGLNTYLDDDGMRVLIVRLPPEEGRAVLSAVEDRAAALAKEREQATGIGAGAREDLDHPSARQADALVELVRDGAAATVGGLDGSVVMVHTTMAVLDGSDPEGRCQLDGGAALAAETARRLSCNGRVQHATDHLGATLDVGRSTARVPAALRRAVRTRDGGCVFPGCASRRGTHMHHVRHWAQGGTTSLENLAELCSFHHHRMHEGGYHLRWNPHARNDGARLGGWQAIRPNGEVVPAVPQVGPADPSLPDLGAEAFSSEWDGSGLNLAMAVDALLADEGLLEMPRFADDAGNDEQGGRPEEPLPPERHWDRPAWPEPWSSPADGWREPERAP